MADVVVTVKLMPKSQKINLKNVEGKAKEAIAAFGGEVGKTEEQPVAFGLKALIIYFVMNESKGSTEELEAALANINGVGSVDVTDVRRAVG